GLLGSILELATAPAVAQLLKQHNLRLVAAPQAGRAITLASFAARSGRAALAIVPNNQLDQSIEHIRQACSLILDRGGALALLLEDDPRRCPASCPRRAAMRIGLPAIGVSDLNQARDAMEHTLRLSRAGRSAVAVIVHQSIVHS